MVNGSRLGLRSKRMKIDVEESIVYRFDSKEDLSQCVLLLGEKGYFSDNEDFSNYEYGTLTRVIVDVSDYSYPFIKGGKIEYRYFITEDAVVFKREEPKKYRPYKDVSEFCNETGCEVVGSDVITIRNKEDKKEYVLLYIGYSDDSVHLGAYVLTFADLLKNYEFSYNDEWLPFGIKE